MSVLTDKMNDFAALGAGAGDKPVRLLLTMMMDNSSSMGHGENSKLVMDGHNGVLDTLAALPQASVFLARTQYMHGKALATGYRSLEKAPRITIKNYHLFGGTPLFSAARRNLRYVRKRAKHYIEQGFDVFTLTLLLTDGYNRDFKNPGLTAEDLHPLVTSMLTQNHIICGAGVVYPDIDFGLVFLRMGISKDWIVDLRNPDEIRAAFGNLSSIAESCSTNEHAFAETKSRGFGTLTQKAN